MDRVIYFPDRIPPEDKGKRWQRNGLTLFLLILFLTLIFQLGSGLYNLIIYNRRLHEMEALLREKRQVVEGLEKQLGRAEPNPLPEMEDK
ncbi:MAG: hypothetical protein GX081_07670 [Firmicutes bacterium]|nr:hypothetical protein [Bacillota bacterium]